MQQSATPSSPLSFSQRTNVRRFLNKDWRCGELIPSGVRRLSESKAEEADGEPREREGGGGGRRGGGGGRGGGGVDEDAHTLVLLLGYCCSPASAED